VNHEQEIIQPTLIQTIYRLGETAENQTLTSLNLTLLTPDVI